MIELLSQTISLEKCSIYYCMRVTKTKDNEKQRSRNYNNNNKRDSVSDAEHKQVSE